LECHWKEFPKQDKAKSKWSEVLGAIGFAGVDPGYLLVCQMGQGWSCLGTEINFLQVEQQVKTSTTTTLCQQSNMLVET
jgi:hypothetical protein